MVTTYFKYLNYSPSTIKNFYTVASANNEYYACAYKDRDKGKGEVMELLGMLPSFAHLKSGNFDFHHVVEEQHIADITFSDKLYFNYGNMPTVMIHKGEHLRYNAILHVGETRSLYLRNQQKFINHNKSAFERKQAAIALVNGGVNNEGITEIKNRIAILRHLYGSVYESNRVLKIISNNIFNEFMKQL